MADKIAKALKKLSDKERVQFKVMLAAIQQNQLAGLDVKKLKNRDNIFRVCKGKMRIIFKKDNDKIYILTLERRSDQTYT